MRNETPRQDADGYRGLPNEHMCPYLPDTGKLYPITYRCPGGLALTYNMTDPSYVQRLRTTWRGGVAIWRMWTREAVSILACGGFPYPKTVTLNVIGKIDRFFRIFKRKAASELEDV